MLCLLFKVNCSCAHYTCSSASMRCQYANTRRVRYRLPGTSIQQYHNRRYQVCSKMRYTLTRHTRTFQPIHLPKTGGEVKPLLLYFCSTKHHITPYHIIPYRTIPHHTIPYHTTPHRATSQRARRSRTSLVRWARSSSSRASAGKLGPAGCWPSWGRPAAGRLPSSTHSLRRYAYIYTHIYCIGQMARVRVSVGQS